MSRAETAARERRRLERKELRHTRQRALIVQAARAVLESVGLASLTIDDVARAAGVGKPSVFYYFASKQELVGAVVVELAGEECQALIAALSGCTSAAEALTTVVRTLVAFYRGRIGTFRAHYLAPQLYGITRAQLLGLASHTHAFFAVCDEKLRADQQRGRLPADKRPGDLTALAWTLGIGILFRASLLEPAGVRTDHSVAQLEREACELIARSLGRRRDL